MHTIMTFLLLVSITIQAMLQEDNPKPQKLLELQGAIQAMFNAEEPGDRVVFAPLGYEPMNILKPMVETYCTMSLYPVFALSQSITCHEVELIGDIKKHILQKYMELLSISRYIYVAPRALAPNNQKLHGKDDFMCPDHLYAYCCPTKKWATIEKHEKIENDKITIFCLMQQSWALLKEGGLFSEVILTDVSNAHKDKKVSHLFVVDTLFPASNIDYTADAQIVLERIQKTYFPFRSKIQ